VSVNFKQLVFSLFFSFFIYCNIFSVPHAHGIVDDVLASAATICSKLEIIDDEIDTIDSKLDAADIELGSIESKLDAWIGPLVETSDSKLDVIESKVCEILIDTDAIDSKLDEANIELGSIESKLDTWIGPNLESINTRISILLKGDVITAGANAIVTDGLYTMTSNLTGCITIDADNVTIDMCGFRLFCDSGANAVIEILTGHANIKIKNGVLKSDVTLDGILTASANKSIKITDIDSFLCDNGIHFDGIEGQEITCCEVEHCSFTECNKGVLLNFARKCVFENCRACCCTQAGFELLFSDFNCFLQCKAIRTQNADLDLSAVGFSSFAGTGNLFKECVAEGTKKTASNFGIHAIGFLLTGTEGDMETETKIIDCIANSTEIDLTGSGCAYGIKLQPFILSDAFTTTVTSLDYGASIRSVSWSPDGRFLAVGGNGPTSPNDEIEVFSFDGSSLTLLTNTVRNFGVTVHSVHWSPCGKFLAIGGQQPTGSDEIQVYSFDGSSLSASPVASFDYGTNGAGTQVFSVNWSPCGRYLAVGGDTVTAPNDEIQVLSFDGSSLTLLIDTVKNYGDSTGAVFAVAWSPCGKFLAAGGIITSIFGFGEIQIYGFDGSSLTLLASDDPFQVNKIGWSPCGRYLAVVGFDAAVEPDDEIKVYSFDGLSITVIASFNFGNEIHSVDWSPCGRFLAVGGHNPLDPPDAEIQILSFDGSSLVVAAIADYGAGNSTRLFSVDWSPCGRYLALGGLNPTDPPDHELQVFEVMDAPTGCIIDNNIASNSSSNGDLGGRAVGISGLCDNLFIRNIAENSLINITQGFPYKFFYYDPVAPLEKFDNIWSPNC